MQTRAEVMLTNADPDVAVDLLNISTEELITKFPDKVEAFIHAEEGDDGEDSEETEAEMGT